MPKRKIEQYEHKDKERVNNPPVGMVTPSTDPYAVDKKKYEHDPHIDPQLNWASKKEEKSFSIDTVSLHVHERIDPKSIIKAVEKDTDDGIQIPLFETKKPLREAIEFYKHKLGWSNRLIAGDSLLVMNSLIEKEGMENQIKMVYIDPPYGIKYGSNFQPFVNKKTVSEKEEDLSSEPEMIKAFRDTWQLGIHSYLTYLRDRLLLTHKLLSDDGSVFVQISDENVHLVRNILDEIFGAENYVSQISIKRASVMFAKKLLNNAIYYVLWYAKDKTKLQYNQLYKPKTPEWFVNSAGSHSRIESPDGKTSRPLTSEERKNIKKFLSENKGWRLYRLLGVNAQGTDKREPFEFEGKTFVPPNGTQWKYSYKGMEVLKEKNRLEIEKNSLGCKVYLKDFPVESINSLWQKIGAAGNKVYVVQTSDEIIKRCILMSTQPGDIVFDPTCGSGTTAYSAEQWGRRWITCDTSRIAINLAKKRLMTSFYDYYELFDDEEGIASGLRYHKAAHVTLGSIANNEIPKEETLYDKPYKDTKRARITGPFTVEAVPSQHTKNFDDIANSNEVIDDSISRSGSTLNQNEWRNELLGSGIRTKNGNIIKFSRVELKSGTKYIQAEAETIEDNPKKVFIVFGPEHAPLEQRIVELAWTEARSFKPDILLFCAFHFDEEAAKDIDELTPDKAGMQLLKIQMNTDLLTKDLRKKSISNESFWLIGQPDIKIHKCNDDKIKVEVLGFDYYNPKTGNVESGGTQNISMWMLDIDYDERCIFPSQVFFPLSSKNQDWGLLAKNLKAEIDIEKIEFYSGNISLEFNPGNQVAVKIIDDRGIESLKIIRL
tara:strand:+ start:755 stop:3238 length:2484 start_codon:yes stop_codon:yes gene_type:complete